MTNNQLLKDALSCKPTWLDFFSFLGNKEGGMMLIYMKSDTQKACFAVRDNDVPRVITILKKSIDDFEKIYYGPQKISEPNKD